MASTNSGLQNSNTGWNQDNLIKMDAIVHPEEKGVQTLTVSLDFEFCIANERIFSAKTCIIFVKTFLQKC